MKGVERLLRTRFLGNEYRDWVFALGVAALCVLVGFSVRRLARRQRERLEATPETEILETVVRALSRTSTLFLWIVGCYVGSLLLSLSKRVDHGLGTAFTVVCFLQVGVWAASAVGSVFAHKQRNALGTNPAAAGTFALLGFVGRVLVWATVLVLSLDNLGVNVTALVAGLGVGGIAVALAVQNVLGDLLASLSIALDRPFVLGETLAVGEHVGTVEYIGIKSTRLRSVDGEQIIISNADIIRSRVRNFGRMAERRVLFNLGVAPATGVADLERLPELFREAIEPVPNTRFARAHLARITDGSFEFEVVFMVIGNDYNVFMDAQQSVYLRILRHLQEQGISLGFPGRRLVVSHEQA